MSVSCRSVIPPETGTTASSQALAAVVEAEAAGEQAVAVGVVQGHPGLGAGRRERARHDAREDVEVRSV